MFIDRIPETSDLAQHGMTICGEHQVVAQRSILLLYHGVTGEPTFLEGT